MKTKGLFVSLMLGLMGNEVNGQVLHTENFNVILDTSKHIKGSFTPNFRYRNLAEDFIELENTTDISLRYKNHGITAANKLEYAVFGTESLMSGGFLYLEYQSTRDKHLAIEPFVQMHWQEVRGLDRKYAGGVNLRWRAIENASTGLYLGVGSLYEYEKWLLTDVAEPDSLSIYLSPREVQHFRACSYISYKQKVGELIVLDCSAYYQPRYFNPAENHRLASSWEVIYNINRFLGLSVLYQNIFDSNPVMPIPKLFHDINLGLTFNF